MSLSDPATLIVFLCTVVGTAAGAVAYAVRYARSVIVPEVESIITRRLSGYPTRVEMGAEMRAQGAELRTQIKEDLRRGISPEAIGKLTAILPRIEYMAQRWERSHEQLQRELVAVLAKLGEAKGERHAVD